jgi:hypothetical protein
MKPITNDMLSSLIQKFQSGRQPSLPPTNMTNGVGILGTSIIAPIGAMTLALMGRLNSPAESPAETEKLTSALSFLSSDTGYGSGRFYTSSGSPESDYWLAGIWAIASLNWSSGKDIARGWSKQSVRYTEDGFEKAWNSYNPKHPNGVGVGSLYKRVKELGWQMPVANANTSPPSLDTGRYKILWPSDVSAIPSIQWRIKHVLPATGLAAVYGPSGSGKSFLALDLGRAIAHGNPWFGIRTYQAPVVYVMLEGEGGIKNRVNALEQANGPLPANGFGVITQSFQLTRPQDVVDLAEVVPKGSVVFIDTLNRAAPTSDENSSKEMGEILEAAKALYKATNSLVILVHHTGKDTGRGMRGHSSLVAALDGAIEVQRSDQKRSWTVAKSKDGEDGKTVNFKLKHHVLGQDADGEDITSCSIEPDHSAIFVTKEPSGDKQKKALGAVKQTLASSPHLGVAGSGSNTPCITVSDAVAAVSVTLTTELNNKRNNRAKTLIESLIKGDYLGTGLDAAGDGWVWKI